MHVDDSGVSHTSVIYGEVHGVLFYIFAREIGCHQFNYIILLKFVTNKTLIIFL